MDTGTTTNVFGGKDGQGQRVFNADGYHLRARDRFSIATLNQLALEYRGQFIDEKLTVVAGVRAPSKKGDTRTPFDWQRPVR